jgi:polyhydroxyalkanoate synthase
MLRSETQGDPERAAAALAGLQAYQRATRAARPEPMPVIATAGRARLRDFGGSGRPVVVVPSLINGPDILDLVPDRSLLRWLAGRGLNPLLVDWCTPTETDRGLSVAGHVEQLLLPLLRNIPAEQALVGYCLGGTMALAASAVRRPSALALIATPWRFAGFADDARRGLADLWTRAQPTADAIGLLPIEVLQAAFWQLEPRRSVDKFVAFGRTQRDTETTRLFVALEDWANGGPPLTYAAGEELIGALFGDDITGKAAWQVAGRSVDPRALGCPVLDIVSTTDRIVPAASAAGIGRRMVLAQGHVGMVVGGRAQTTLWEPLARWLRAPDLG